jgi:hypothetical protein
MFLRFWWEGMHREKHWCMQECIEFSKKKYKSHPVHSFVNKCVLLVSVGGM